MSARIDKSDWQVPQKLEKIGEMPPIHSQNRQELCEALPYFRSYQGGHYVSNGITKGYLLDGCPAPRDVFEDSGRVIISHGGGGSKVSQPSGPGQAPQLSFVNSQERSNYRIKALSNCLDNQIPVVLLAGKNYLGMPWIKRYRSVTYVVLGFYLVTHCWPERERRKDIPSEFCVRFKFRFQWMSSQGDPWWLSDMEEYLSNSMDCDLNSESSVLEWASNSARSDETENSSPDTSSDSSSLLCDESTTEEACQEDLCHVCGNTSIELYKGQWMCLNELCPRHFRMDRSPNFDELKYLEWFLQHQESLETEFRVPYQLRPRILQDLGSNELDRRANEQPNRGFYCSFCGRLSRTVYLDYLTCSNEECKFTVELSLNAVHSVFHDLPSFYRRRTGDKFNEDCFESVKTFSVPNYSVIHYRFIDHSGFILHASPTAEWIQRTDNHLLGIFQKALKPFSFKRNKLRHSMVNGMVAQAFTMNCGQAYKYCAEVETVAWGAVSVPVLTAYSQICRFLDALDTFAPDELIQKPLPKYLNEILSCCYLPGSGMNYHSDDELGIGPLIGSLSLGSPGLMKFKRKHPPEKVDPTLKQSNPPVLELLLKHGDILIQFGYEIQQNYLHSLHSDDFRIAATARYIDGNIMK